MKNLKNNLIQRKKYIYKIKQKKKKYNIYKIKQSIKSII